MLNALLPLDTYFFGKPSPCSIKWVKTHFRINKEAQQVKASAAKSDTPSSIPGTHRLEGKN